MVPRNYAIAGGAAAAMATGILVALAQSQAIFVPYITPTTLHIDGLQEAYGLNGTAAFTVTAKGYGSNCHMLQVEVLHENGDRASYYKKADDCRFMTITHGPYNFTRPFSYGSEVMGKAGKYTIDIQFRDLVDNTEARLTKTFQMEK